ncbi:hypothetical protein [Streptomyces sp. FH025]|uniref:hypothetical protein n=1 Tax=Streptomyces sp. FH025 TaxID=2815937 RepID=UPI001A9E6BE3|nr:hypothetical protein [Streptomyces sp. FH025]MBO1417420.1 hypothetical protein [Streptomyces sp. FH025]
MVPRIAARGALHDEQQAQVQLVERHSVPQGGGGVEVAAVFGVAGGEVAVRAGVAAEGQRDQLGGRVAPAPSGVSATWSGSDANPPAFWLNGAACAIG